MHFELPYSATLQAQCRVLVLEAMRDQRHGCAEATQLINDRYADGSPEARAIDEYRSRAHRAAMNAEPKEQS